MPAADRNRSIEGLRGFSALLVIVYHVYNMSVGAGFFRPVSNPVLAEGLAKLGPFGVMLFFCISGYLILQSLVKHRSVRRFLENRAIRIYPAFLALHLAIFVIGPLTGYAWMGSLRHSVTGWVSHFVSNLLFLPGMLDLPLAQKNAWSLSFEAAFYLVASVLYLAWANRRSRPAAGAALAVVGIAASVAAIAWRPDSAFFLVGVAAFAIGGRVAGRRWLAPAGIAGLVLALACYRWSTPLAMACGFVAFLSVVREVGWFPALLRTRPFQYLGQVSYSLYLVHPFVLHPLRAVVRRLSHTGQGAEWLLLFGVAGVVLSIAVAALSFRFLETAGSRMLRRALSPAAPQTHRQDTEIPVRAAA